MWLQFPLLKKEIMPEALRHAGDENYNEIKQTQVMQLYIHLGGCAEICRKNNSLPGRFKTVPELCLFSVRLSLSDCVY